MPSPSRDSLFRLASFAESVWLPAIRGGDSRSVWQHGQALEAFLWLDLGVKVGAFDESVARDLVGKASSNVLEALAMFDQERLVGVFPDHLRQIVRRSFASGEYFVKDSDAFRGGTNLTAPFETLMMTAIEHGRDYRTEKVFAQTLFDDDSTWAVLHPDAVLFGKYSNREIFDQDGLLAHFAWSLGYWIDMDAHFRRLLEDRRFDYASRIALVGDAAGIQMWKFNFTVGRVRDRVLLAASAALGGLADRESGIEVSADQLQEFRESLVAEISGLMERWESHLQLSVGQVAGLA